MENPVFQADYCPLTGIRKPELKVYESGIRKDFGARGFQWFYPYKESFLMIVEEELYYDQPFWDSNRPGIYYLIENGKWPGSKMIYRSMIDSMLSSSGVPRSPLEKIDELVMYVAGKSGFYGDQVTLASRDYESYVRKIGLVNSDELEALIRESSNFGFLEIKGSTKMAISTALTLKGWEIARDKKQERQSNTVFVAMSFDQEMIQVYNNWIEPAIKESGFEPYIVLDQHTESDVTINDAILAGIKKAKFTIADFTHHKSGVYFEAGYALGRGQKVIYTCREDHIGTAHFDTRNYQHLVWKDGADLKKKLMDKIEVFIKS